MTPLRISAGYKDPGLGNGGLSLTSIWALPVEFPFCYGLVPLRGEGRGRKREGDTGGKDKGVTCKDSIGDTSGL